MYLIKLQIPTLRSEDIVANLVPSGEKLRLKSFVLFLTKSNKSVSSFDSNFAHFGNL